MLGGTVSGTQNPSEQMAMQNVCYGFCDMNAAVNGRMFLAFPLTSASGKQP